MPFSKRIEKEVTPKRLYSFLKLVEYKEMTRDLLEEYITPTNLSKNKVPFNQVYTFSRNVEFITEDLGVSLWKITSEHLKDWKSYRKYMAKVLFSKEDSNFYKLTEWYLKKGKKVLNYNSSADIQNDFKKELKDLNENDVLGWRFWMEFLGIGILSSSIIIPNLYKRIQDALEEDCFEKDIEMSIDKFMGILLKYGNEFKCCLDGNNINFGLSNGLRTLHDQGVIELINTKDSTNVWHLYRMEHSIIDDITSIKIMGDSNE